MSRFAVLAISVAAAVCIMSAAASAAPSTAGWTLTPVVNGNNVTFVLGIDNMADLASYDGAVTKTWGDPTLTDSSQFISLGDGGILQSLTAIVDGDPVVSLEFKYIAGPSGSNFSVLSDLVTFAPLVDPTGSATAAVTVTDLDGDGVSATGAFGGKMYRATYQSPMTTATASFADLISGPITAGPIWSDTGSENYGPVQIAGTVNSIQSEFAFHLSANDSASGTSFFIVQPVPEPASLVALLAGCTGLLGLVRRRQS